MATADNGLHQRWGRGHGWRPAGPRGGAGPAEAPRAAVAPHLLSPRRGVRVGFQSHLKSLSLDVIFSSKLEMWYEALAMLPGSIPPAGSVAAGARGPGSSSRWRRRPLPGSQRDTDWGRWFDTMSGPRPDGEGACPGLEGRGRETVTGRPNDGAARGARSSWAAGQTAGLTGKPDTWARAVSLPLPPHSLFRARGQSPPPSLGGRGPADAGGGRVGVHGGCSPARSAQAPLKGTLPLGVSDVRLLAHRLSGGMATPQGPFLARP